METMCGTDKRQKKKKIEWLVTAATAAALLAGCGADIQQTSKPMFARTQLVREKDKGEVCGSKVLMILGRNGNIPLINKLILLSR